MFKKHFLLGSNNDLITQRNRLSQCNCNTKLYFMCDSNTLIKVNGEQCSCATFVESHRGSPYEKLT